MIVFGAGASHDSAPDNPTSPNPTAERKRIGRPPLTVDLFEDRQEYHEALLEFREVHTLVPQLRNLPHGVPLEQFLADLQQQATELPYRSRELTALRYYLRRVLSSVPRQWYADRAGITNYSALLFDVQEWQARTRDAVAFVTFNYDLMLDFAYGSALGIRLDAFSSPDLEAYVARPPFFLFKPHGSVNWVRLGNLLAEVTGGSSSVHDLINGADRFVPSDEFEINDSLDPTQAARDPTRAAMPALAIPVNTKTTFECPPLHISNLSGLIPNITHLVTIGWRATEQSFLGLWEGRVSGSLRVHTVSPGDPDVTAANLRNGGIYGEVTTSHMGYTEYVAQRRIRDFLELPG